MGGTADAEFASGGMATKLAAARIASAAGVGMIIYKRFDDRPVSSLLSGANAVSSHADQLGKSRKTWIAGALDPKGSILVDQGAQTALRQGKSLLPAGVAKINGQFERGDLVVVLTETGTELGHGLAGHSSAEADKLKGHNSKGFCHDIGV